MVKTNKKYNKNSIFTLLNNYSLSKEIKKYMIFQYVYNDDQKINNINKNHIIEYIKSFNNEIGSFYIKNELEKINFIIVKYFIYQMIIKLYI